MNDLERNEPLKGFLQVLGMDNADPDLVYLALTHRSYSFEHGLAVDNERLEFLGDAVLGFIVSCYLYENNPEADEGFLSKRKARLVSRSILGRQAKTLGLGSLILLGKGEEMTGGRRRSSLLGSALEALIGALYLPVPGRGSPLLSVKESFNLRKIFLSSTSLPIINPDFRSRCRNSSIAFRIINCWTNPGRITRRASAWRYLFRVNLTAWDMDLG
jgi:23S rRNA maturation mini-RNase III